MPIFGWGGGQLLQINCPKLRGKGEISPDSSYDLYLTVILWETRAENVERCSETTE